LFASISNERLRHCGCKSTPFIELSKPFLNLFLKYFLKHWLIAVYNAKFFQEVEAKMGVFGDLIAFIIPRYKSERRFIRIR